VNVPRIALPYANFGNPYGDMAVTCTWVLFAYNTGLFSHNVCQCVCFFLSNLLFYVLIYILKLNLNKMHNVAVQVPIEELAAPTDANNVLPAVREMAVNDRYVHCDVKHIR